MDALRNGAVQADETYDVLRLMITLHVEKLTSKKWTTSENLAALAAENQAIWTQTARRRKTYATIVRSRGTLPRTARSQSLMVKEAFGTHVNAVVGPVRTASEAKALTKARKATQ